MYCEKCGAKLPDDARFCDACGAPTILAEEKQEDQLTGESQPQPTQDAAASLQAELSKKIEPITVVVIVLSVVAAVMVVGLVALYVVKPPISSLANTPFSSITTGGGSTLDEGAFDKESVGESTSHSDGEDANSASDSAPDSEESDVAEDVSTTGNADDTGRPGNTSATGNYIIPDSSSRLLSASDLSGYSDDELCIAMNEIWTRHGRRFNNQWLQRYFDGQDWYSGTIDADSFLSRYKPTDTENANASTIMGILNNHGYDVNRVHPNG